MNTYSYPKIQSIPILYKLPFSWITCTNEGSGLSIGLHIKYQSYFKSSSQSCRLKSTMMGDVCTFTLAW